VCIPLPVFAFLPTARLPLPTGIHTIPYRTHHYRRVQCDSWTFHTDGGRYIPLYERVTGRDCGFHGIFWDGHLQTTSAGIVGTPPVNSLPRTWTVYGVAHRHPYAGRHIHAPYACRSRGRGTNWLDLSTYHASSTATRGTPANYFLFTPPLLISTPRSVVTRRPFWLLDGHCVAGSTTATTAPYHPPHTTAYCLNLLQLTPTPSFCPALAFVNACRYLALIAACR